MGSAAQTAFRPGTGVDADPSSAQQRARPFCQASKLGLAPCYSPAAQIPGSAAINLGPTPLPASGGYLRRVFLELVATGGGGTTPGVGQGDYPWNLINEVRFLEPNGTPILDLSGYNLLLADTYGGYAGCPDPRVDPDYSNNGSNPNIEPYIPLELDTTGRGALADLSSSSAFQLYLSLAQTSVPWSTVPNPVPSVAVAAYQDYWTLPNPVDQNNNPQATAPPYPGTIQLWSQLPNIPIASGQRVALTRMGNQLRTVIMVFRTGTGNGARSETPAPNPLNLRWDDVILDNVDLQSLRKIMRESVNQLQARDTGVYVLPYNRGLSRFVGGNGVSSYLPTVTATRYEISGASGGTGTVDWVVNEVTSAPVSGVQRSSVGGGLQYYPPNPAPAGPGTM